MSDSTPEHASSDNPVFAELMSTLGIGFAQQLAQLIATRHRVNMALFRKVDPPAATPLGGFVRINSKPTDSATPPHWEDEMDKYVGTVGQVLGSGSTEHANWLTVAVISDDQTCFAEYSYKLSWVTPIETATVAPPLRRLFAQVEATTARILAKETVAGCKEQNADWPAGSLVRREGTTRVALVIGRDPHNTGGALLVMLAAPICRCDSLLIANARAVAEPEYLALPGDERTALAELHGYIKHKHVKKYLRKGKPFPVDFVSLPAGGGGGGGSSGSDEAPAKASKKRRNEK
jgi:hypothetical protein